MPNSGAKRLKLVIKHLYANIPINKVIGITQPFLHYSNSNKTLQQQTVTLRAILQTSYFYYNNEFYRLSNGVALGSPISSFVAEIFLHYFRHQIIKHSVENKSVIVFTHYVHDILIICDHSKATHAQVLHFANSVHNNFSNYETQ
jgi:hypothetical protein